jgi:putative cell wall-binding protein
VTTDAGGVVRRAAATGWLAVVLALVATLAVVTAGPAHAADEDTEEADETITVTVDAGETAYSDAASSIPSHSNPIIAGVTSPVDGDIELTKLSTVPEVSGYDTFGAITVTAPTATASDPLRLSIAFDTSDLPTGISLPSLVLLRDGTPVPSCIGTETATPDPCFVSRTVARDAMTIVALSSEASTWTAAHRRMERVTPDSTLAADPGAIAIAASRRSFAPQTAHAVVLARVDDFADALAGSPLARVRNGPLLLTSTDALDDATLDEITRVLPTNKIVYVLGGEAAISDAVVDRLRSWGYLVSRYAGTDRYETAVAIAELGLSNPDVVVETTGADFADALSAGAVAAHLGGAVLLTAADQQSDATAGYIAEHHPTRYAIGGPSAIADRAAMAFAGQDRVETAVLAARHFFSSPATLTMASGYSYAEAVTASASAAAEGSPLLLLPASGDLPVPLSIYLRQLVTEMPTAVLVGSTSALGATLETAVSEALAGL